MPIFSSAVVEYCRPFLEWNNEWPPLPLSNDVQMEWWSQWMTSTKEDQQWIELSKCLPQLLIQVEKNAREGIQYKRLVLQGAEASAADLDGGMAEPHGFNLSIAEHWSGSMPVITVDKGEDFKNILRCLVYRCEPVEIQSSVHSQAISGLIHWGLIRKIDRSKRCALLILHNAPYSSLDFKGISGVDNYEQWLRLSHQWRLEHELTHIACKAVVGEMRLNLYDELLADCMGMLKSIGHFSSKLFAKGLGVTEEGLFTESSRMHAYTRELNVQDKSVVSQLAFERAVELEQMLDGELKGIDNISLLRLLTRNTLDKKLST